MFSEKVIKALKRSVDAGSPAHGPVSVQVLASGICNAACVFCPVHSPTIPLELKRKQAPRLIPGGELLDIDLYRAFVDDLENLGLTRRIQYTGLGEPLVHPGFLEMVTYARARLPGCSLIVVTNGILLKRYCRELADAGVDEISVSLNAGEFGTWAATNRKGTESQFHGIMEALEFLGRMKKPGRPRLTVTAVLNKHNYDSLRDLLRITRQSKGEALNFFRMMVMDLGGAACNREFLCSPEQFRKFEETLEETKRDTGGVSVNLCGIGPGDGSLDTASVAATTPCYAGWTFALLYPDGSVYPCCNCETSLGNVAREPFREIWRSERYAAFRTRVMDIPRLGVMPGCLCNECGYYHENREYHWALSLPSPRVLSEALEGSPVFPAPASFGGLVDLSAAGLSATAVNGQDRRLDLLFRVRSPLPAGYFAAVHSLAADGTIVHQVDFPLDKARGLGSGEKWVESVRIPIHCLEKTKEIGVAVYSDPKNPLTVAYSRTDYGGRRALLDFFRLGQ